MSYDSSGGLTGWDLTGFHEGHDTECWRRLGAHEMTVTDSERGEISRHPILGLGAQCPGRAARRRLQLLERRGALHAAGARIRGLGAVRRRSQHRQPLQVRGTGRPTASGGSRPIRWRASPRPHRTPRRSSTRASTSGATTSGCGTAARRSMHEEPMSIYEVHIGSWRKGLTYLELANELVEYCQLAGLHARGVHAGRPASVRRLLGLSRHRLLRSDVEVRLTR